MNGAKSKKEWIITPGITAFMILLIYAVKGVFFSQDGITLSDIDTTGLYIPFYVRAYDVLHGNAPLLFDWFTGAVSDMGTSMPVYVLNPFNWLFLLLVPREMIPSAMPFFLLVKMLMISLSALFCLKRSYRLPAISNIMLSLLYTFSGYVLMYQVNIFFLDTVFLFPLLMLSLRHMLRNGNSLPYLLVLWLQLLTNAYLSIMVLFWIVFYMFGYLYLIEEPDKRSRQAAKLGFSTFGSIGLSAVFVLPQVLKWSQSTRIAKKGNHSLIDLLAGKADDDIFLTSFQKSFMLFGSELAFAFLVTIIIKHIQKKRRLERKVLFFVYQMTLLVIPVFVSSSDLLWHMGSHLNYPMRFGFIISFAAIDFIASCLNCHEDLQFSIQLTSKDRKILQITVIALMIICLGFLVMISKYIWVVGLQGIAIEDSSIFGYLQSYRILMMMICVLVLVFKNARFCQKFFFCFMTAQLLIAGAGFLEPAGETPEKVIDKEKHYSVFGYFSDKEPLEETFTLKLNRENDNISRVKQLYPYLGYNYPLVMNVPALSQQTHETTTQFVEQMQMSGYDFDYYDATLDTGGTVFSDALFNVKNAIVYGDSAIDSRLYTKTQTIGEYDICECNYQLPFGLLTDEKILQIQRTAAGFAHQNEVYQQFSGDSEPIITRIKASDAEESRNPDDTDLYYVFTYHIPVKDACVLYLHCLHGEDDESSVKYRASVNGEPVKFPYFRRTDNTDYPLMMNGGIRALGTYENETVTLTIYARGYTADKLEIGLLHLDKLEALEQQYEHSCVSSYHADNSELTLEADISDRQYLFLPIEYRQNWEADVNGNPAELLPVLDDAFIAVKLPEGHCTVTLTYHSKAHKTGLFISIIALITVTVLYLMQYFGHAVTEVKFVQKAAIFCFTALGAGMLLCFYLIPILFKVLRL